MANDLQSTIGQVRCDHIIRQTRGTYAQQGESMNALVSVHGHRASNSDRDAFALMREQPVGFIAEVAIHETRQAREVGRSVDGFMCAQ